MVGGNISWRHAHKYRLTFSTRSGVGLCVSESDGAAAAGVVFTVLTVVYALKSQSVSIGPARYQLSNNAS